MTSFYYAPGMMRPYWAVYEQKDWPESGVTTKIATNADADTDMGNLYGDEFAKYFPAAMPITEDQYKNRSITMADYRKWRKKR